MLQHSATGHAIAMRPRTTFLRAAEIRVVPLARPLLLGPAARRGIDGRKADLGWRFSGVFRPAAFGATHPPTCLGVLPMTSMAAATAPVPAAEGASPSTAMSRPNSAA